MDETIEFDSLELVTPKILKLHDSKINIVKTYKLQIQNILQKLLKTKNIINLTFLPDVDDVQIIFQYPKEEKIYFGSLTVKKFDEEIRNIPGLRNVLSDEYTMTLFGKSIVFQKYIEHIRQIIRDELHLEMEDKCDMFIEHNFDSKKQKNQCSCELHLIMPDFYENKITTSFWKTILQKFKNHHNVRKAFTIEFPFPLHGYNTNVKLFGKEFINVTSEYFSLSREDIFVRFIKKKKLIFLIIEIPSYVDFELMKGFSENYLFLFQSKIPNLQFCLINSNKHVQ